MNITIGNHTYACDISEYGKTIFDNRADFMKYIHDIIQELQEDFPALFPEKPQPKLPLAIGIHKILADWAENKGVSQRNLEIALHYWTKGKRYQAALKVGKELGVRFGVGYTWETVSVHSYGKGSTDEYNTLRNTADIPRYSSIAYFTGSMNIIAVARWYLRKCNTIWYESPMQIPRHDLVSP